MTEHTAIWDALGKTDPGATKPFKRGGGFSGTSVKPMWVLRRLTEQFGPAGEGWGVNEPRFQVVEAAGDTLVYCTVSAWHGKRENVLWGVGGDKVAGKNKNGPFSDDEAFKKAFTDAINNAFKSLGVAADIHMGLFDDDKYVNQMREEFEDKPELPASIQAALDAIAACDTKLQLKGWWDAHGAAIPDEHAERISKAIDLRASQINTMTRVAA